MTDVSLPHLRSMVTTALAHGGEANFKRRSPSYAHSVATGMGLRRVQARTDHTSCLRSTALVKAAADGREHALHETKRDMWAQAADETAPMPRRRPWMDLERGHKPLRAGD